MKALDTVVRIVYVVAILAVVVGTVYVYFEASVGQSPMVALETLFSALGQPTW